MREYYRTFIGIPVHQQVNQRIDRWLGSVAAEAAFRPGVAGNRHLTLAFLGETPVEQIAPIAEALRARFTEPDCCPEELLLSGFGVFPTRGVPRVIWVGIEEGRNWLERLSRVIRQVLGPFGFGPEKRAFFPHLTLGRPKAKSAEKILQLVETGKALQFGAWRPDSAIFYSSVREKGEVCYSTLATLPF